MYLLTCLPPVRLLMLQLLLLQAAFLLFANLVTDALGRVILVT